MIVHVATTDDGDHVYSDGSIVFYGVRAFVAARLGGGGLAKSIGKSLYLRCDEDDALTALAVARVYKDPYASRVVACEVPGAIAWLDDNRICVYVRKHGELLGGWHMWTDGFSCDEAMTLAVRHWMRVLS